MFIIIIIIIIIVVVVVVVVVVTTTLNKTITYGLCMFVTYTYYKATFMHFKYCISVMLKGWEI
jgi:hypothetical protein